MTDTINSLTDEYQDYCARHGLPLLSANELLGKLTELDNPSEARRERIYWLTNFISRWDAADREEESAEMRGEGGTWWDGPRP